MSDTFESLWAECSEPSDRDDGERRDLADLFWRSGAAAVKREWEDWAEKRRAALAEHNRAVRAEERERIRLELLVEAERLDEFRLGAGAAALRDFARRLETARPEAPLDHSDLPGECPAILWHGPGHQSRARCRLRGPHAIHETVYGSARQFARWEGDKAFSGVFNEPPPEPKP